jgi:hypothetical protein
LKRTPPDVTPAPRAAAIFFGGRNQWTHKTLVHF